MGLLAKEFCGKFCGNSAENLPKFAEMRFIAPGKRCGNSAEFARKFSGNSAEMFCNDPFPNIPISELLIKELGQLHDGNRTLCLSIHWANPGHGLRNSNTYAIFYELNTYHPKREKYIRILRLKTRLRNSMRIHIDILSAIKLNEIRIPQPFLENWSYKGCNYTYVNNYWLMSSNSIRMHMHLKNRQEFHMYLFLHGWYQSLTA